jgi:hypothetical protein
LRSRWRRRSREASGDNETDMWGSKFKVQSSRFRVEA